MPDDYDALDELIEKNRKVKKNAWENFEIRIKFYKFLNSY